MPSLKTLNTLNRVINQDLIFLPGCLALDFSLEEPIKILISLPPKAGFDKSSSYMAVPCHGLFFQAQLNGQFPSLKDTLLLGSGNG